MRAARLYPASFPGRQRGLALMISLIFLVVITLLALAAVNTGTLEERMTSGQRENLISLQSAESAVDDAAEWLTRPVNQVTTIIPCDYVENPTPCAQNSPVWTRAPDSVFADPSFNWQTRGRQFGFNYTTAVQQKPSYTGNTAAAAHPRHVIVLVSTAYKETASDRGDSIKLGGVNDKYLYRLVGWGTGRFTNAGNTPSVTSIVETFYVTR